MIISTKISLFIFFIKVYADTEKSCFNLILFVEKIEKTVLFVKNFVEKTMLSKMEKEKNWYWIWFFCV